MSAWIVRITAVVALLLGGTSLAHAQSTGTVTGTVTDAESGQTMAGAQVFIPATEQGVLTGSNGTYAIPNVPAGEHTVQVQILGYARMEQTVNVTAGATVTANFAVRRQAIDVEGVVVTALGISRSERGLGYAVQNLDADALAEIPTLNVTEALQGRIAGVRVTRTSSRPGATSRVVIRGESSFMGSGQPLWVIDGVPIEMETDLQGGNPLEVGQTGSRSMDIDMNNVEEMSVLRGSAATALYGSRAAHGAVIIRTRQGESGAPTRFSMNTRYSATQGEFHGYQETFTAGRENPDTGEPMFCNGLPRDYGGWCESAYYEHFTNPTSNNNFGPHKHELSQEIMDQMCPGESDVTKCLRIRDPRKDFYQTGQLLETSINASGGIGGGGSFNIAGTYANDEGIEPNTSLERINLNTNITLQLTDRLQSTTTAMYSNTNNVWATEGWQGLHQRMWYLNNTIDTRRAWNEDGTPVMWGSNSPHPEWQALNESRTGTADRWIGSQYFAFDITDRLTLSNRLGMDMYNEVRTSNNNERPWRTAEGLNSGSTRQERHRRMSINNDLILSMSNTPITNDFTLSGVAGFNVIHRENDRLVGTGSNIVIPGFYNLNNFLNQNRFGDLTQSRRLMGLYGQATIDYKDWAYVNLTARNDWSSTLPLEANSYFYPSASLNVIFTDALGIRNQWLDYGKVRMSVAKVGSDAPPYNLATNYEQAGRVDWPFHGTLGFIQDTNLGNPDLRPESTTEYEVGLELRGIDGRVRMDLSYYDKRSFDQIFSVPSSPATGYTSIVRNAGDLRNEGIEATLNMVPVQTSNIRWDVNMNWSRNKSMVQELAPGVVSIHLAGYTSSSVRILEGEGYGVIYVPGWQRTDDGQPIIDDDLESDTYGWPLLHDDMRVVGNAQPDWLGNLGSSFTYGPLTLSGLLSRVQGGEILNFTLNYVIGRGAHDWTLDRGTRFVEPGVKASNGQPNDIEILRDENYYKNSLGGYLRNENYVESGTHTRLQEISLQYRLPQNLLDRMGVGNASLYATGHNLHIWSDFSFWDPQGSNYGDTNAGGSAMHMFVAPPAKSFTFGVRANF
ncbi:MAG: SusC/RagA family TonB-linked outer membrane protein [Gemmatimonadota bacterium]